MKKKNKNQFDIKDILSLLPHKYPFLLIDKVIDFKPNFIKGVKNVTYNEQHFVGHFMNKPIMPGVLITESMSQLSGILILKNEKEINNSIAYLVGLDSVKFYKPVIPGDTLHITSILLQKSGSFYKFECISYVDQIKVATAKISLIQDK